MSQQYTHPSQGITRRHLIGGMLASGFAAPAIVRSAPSFRVGISLPLTGVQAEIGAEMKVGYEMAFENAGMPFALKFLDDASKADNAAENMRLFAGDKGVILSSGIVGTPHAQAAIPIALSAELPIVGIRSGARSLRNGKNTVFHLRSTFEDEITHMVKDAAGRGQKRLAIVYSDDSFGVASKDWMLSEMKRFGLEEAISLNVDRDGVRNNEVCAKVAEAVKKENTAVSIALLMITKPMVAAAKTLRRTFNIMNPIMAMSFTANKTISTEPDASLAGLVVITAFPLPRTASFAGSVQFRKEIMKANLPDLADSFTSYEAWFYGKALASLAGAGSRKDAYSKLQKFVDIAGAQLTFDGNQVGYHHLGIAYKSSAGRLREI